MPELHEDVVHPPRTADMALAVLASRVCAPMPPAPSPPPTLGLASPALGLGTQGGGGAALAEEGFAPEGATPPVPRPGPGPFMAAEVTAAWRDC